MTLETLIVISGMAGSIGALYVSWCAYKESYKATEPDDERVKRFVENAPLHLLEVLSEDSESTLRR